MLKLSKNINLKEISVADMARISSLKTPPGVLALVEIPHSHQVVNDIFKGRFSLALDDVQDPGNMGTIIRTADWFGIKHIFCSEDCVDVYNPKVVQATMGSLLRVNIHYGNLQQMLAAINVPIYGALLSGANVYNTNFDAEGVLVMGNEGNGISPAITALIQQPVTIPQKSETESLNVAVATAIFCSEVFRNSLK